EPPFSWRGSDRPGRSYLGRSLPSWASGRPGSGAKGRRVDDRDRSAYLSSRGVQEGGFRMKRRRITAAEPDVPASTAFISRSPEETHRLGFQIAQDLRIPGVVLLRGALGTGKTTLARGIACGLGLEDPTSVSSPSFTLVNTYQGRCPIYHVDLFRVRTER